MAILVGGAARRMSGAVKSELLLGETRILDRQVEAIAEAGITEVCLVGRWPRPTVGARDVHQVADAVEGAGALGALYTALLTGTAPIVVVLAGDMPFVAASWIRALVAAIGGHDAAVPRVGGRWHPLCAAYRRRLAGIFKARLDRSDLRVSEALTDFDVREMTEPDVARFDSPGRLLMNVNTPDDYLEAERLARSRR